MAGYAGKLAMLKMCFGGAEAEPEALPAMTQDGFAALFGKAG